MEKWLSKIKKGPELLAPAGDFQAFLGAVNAGADAVYLAAEAYGARAYAKNFTKEEILSALHYAHAHDAAIYLTVNTLTKDSEGDGIKEMLTPFYYAGLDGVIVQDLGVMSYIRDVFPNLPIHVSTQATVTSREGARFFQEFGATRVVPARELTLPEIKEIISLGIETECFIHGSMCYSYSGQCLFSSYLGGRSGNRGRCAGPCRQPYNDAYVLSLKDMCTVELLPKLIDAGITSFKIEGRMKSPAYAAGVTAIYRKYIDRYLADPDAEYRVDPKDLTNLKNLYLRTDLQRGYYEKTKDKSMVSITSPSYNKTDEDLSASLIDTYCRKKVPVSIPAKISFVTGRNSGLEFSYRGRDYSLSGDGVLTAKNAPLNAEDLKSRFAKSSEGLFSFQITEAEVSKDAFLPMGAVNALRRQAEEMLSEHIDDAYKMRKINDSVSFSVKKSRPVNSEVAGLKDAVSGFAPDLAEECLSLRIFVTDALQAKEVLKSASELSLGTDLVVPYGIFEEVSDFFGAFEKVSKSFDTNTAKPGLYLELPYVLRSGNHDRLRETILKAEECSFVKGYYVNQMDQYVFLRDIGVSRKIIGNLNLYVMNSRAGEFVLQYLDGFTPAVECSAREVEEISPGEIFFYGRVPLMQTANCVKRTLDKCDKNEGFFDLKDRMKAHFPIYSHCSEKVCYNTIYNSVPLSLHKHAKTLLNDGIRIYQLHFTDETPKEVHSVILSCRDVLLGNEAKKVSYEFTNGHFVKGVL